MAERWWSGDRHERYWLEATDREDIGADLKAPLADASGHDNWRYTLFREAQPGDLVFHYDKKKSAITSVSVVGGAAQPQPIVWAARGSYARERHARPVELPGYRVPLIDHRPLSEPVSLTGLRDRASEIRVLVERLNAAQKGPLYFPFELSDRPLRPMQGYAFKLPADFVLAFPPLAAAAQLHPASEATASKHERLLEVVAAVEAAAEDYEIATLQSLRKTLRNRRRTKVKSLFSADSIRTDYAFHSGGREELQFNIGFDQYDDGDEAFRAGVAFSFELSRSLPSIDVLVPKVQRFNEFLLQNGETLADLLMWQWQPRAGRIPAYAPRPIDASEVREHSFVFLGRLQPADQIDPHLCLRTFDQLLPLYRFVEAAPLVGNAVQTSPNVIAEELLRLDQGQGVRVRRWLQATRTEQQLNIYLRHNELQERLKERRIKEGHTRVLLEVPIGQRCVDMVLQVGEELWFYEIKTAGTVRDCLREAIGQLLEYALWPGATRPSRLIVVGEPALNAAAETYIERLNEQFPIPISYESISLN